MIDPTIKGLIERAYTAGYKHALTDMGGAFDKKLGDNSISTAIAEINKTLELKFADA